MNGILYFSSTGNSLYIAQKVQSRLGGQIRFIPKYEGDGSEFERIYIITPIYSFGMPSHVYDLIPRLNRRSQIIIIQNYGGMAGGADYLIYSYALKYGLNIISVYKMKMPENFTLVFTVPRFYLKKVLKKSQRVIDGIIDKIKNNEFRIPKKQKTKEAAYLKNKSNWRLIGADFSTNEDCIACGKCVALCPAQNISLRDGKIEFADKCVACLGCYHRCEQKAIVYKNKNKKDRYVNPYIDENQIGKDE